MSWRLQQRPLPARAPPGARTLRAPPQRLRRCAMATMDECLPLRVHDDGDCERCAMLHFTNRLPLPIPKVVLAAAGHLELCMPIGYKAALQSTDRLRMPLIRESLVERSWSGWTSRAAAWAGASSPAPPTRPPRCCDSASCSACGSAAATLRQTAGPGPRPSSSSRRMRRRGSARAGALWRWRWQPAQRPPVRLPRHCQGGKVQMLPEAYPALMQ